MLFSLLIRILPLIGTIIGVIILTSLGFWQLERGAEKTAIKSTMDERVTRRPMVIGAAPLNPADHEYYKARAAGEFEPEKVILIDNRILGGVPGLHVIAPFKVTRSQTRLLVNLGWIPWSADRTRYKPFQIPEGPQTIDGLLVHPSQDYYTLDSSQPEPDQLIWQNLDFSDFEAVKNTSVHPLVLLLGPDSDDGFERRWPKYSDDWIARHKGYAVQWFGLAAVLVCVYLLSLLRLRRKIDK